MKNRANEDFARIAQTELARQGFYQGKIDAWAGPNTVAAFRSFVNGPQTSSPPVDERSEKNIQTLLPEVREIARNLIREAKQIGIDAKVISGTRTYAEQEALYAKGRTTSGNIVTNARGGYSNHNFGIAFDIGIFEGPNYLTSGKQYDTVGAIGKRLGLEWGGDWKSIVDKPHFQLRPHWAIGMTESTMLATMRSRVSAGINLFS